MQTCFASLDTESNLAKGGLISGATLAYSKQTAGNINHQNTASIPMFMPNFKYALFLNSC